MRRKKLSVLVVIGFTVCLFRLSALQEGILSSVDAAEEQIRGESSAVLRNRLVDFLASQGITDKKVLAAIRKTPRHEFVPEEYRDSAYDNHPLPIEMNQTISQPFIVAYMTQILKLKGGEKVLEIGTGSGYQAAVLAEIAGKVYTIEILEPLARNAEETLRRLGYRNIYVKAGDGYRGWPEVAPFDAIIVTAAPGHVPQPLVEQLKVGGRMVVPVGDWNQRLILITKDEKGVTQQEDLPVVFVPMTGESQEKNKKK